MSSSSNDFSTIEKLDSLNTQQFIQTCQSLSREKLQQLQHDYQEHYEMMQMRGSSSNEQRNKQSQENDAIGEKLKLITNLLTKKSAPLEAQKDALMDSQIMPGRYSELVKSGTSQQRQEFRTILEKSVNNSDQWNAIKVNLSNDDLSNLSSSYTNVLSTLRGKNGPPAEAQKVIAMLQSY